MTKYTMPLVFSCLGCRCTPARVNAATTSSSPVCLPSAIGTSSRNAYNSDSSSSSSSTQCACTIEQAALRAMHNAAITACIHDSLQAYTG
jgi:hypothetical protein